MNEKLKVYGSRVFTPQGKQKRAVVAVRSRRELAELRNISLSEERN